MPIPKQIKKINKRVTNKLVVFFAGWLPPLAIIEHHGRVSGRKYRTPILAFPTHDGYIFALTYGKDVDWRRNLQALDEGSLIYDGQFDKICHVRDSPYDDCKLMFPSLVRLFLEFLQVSDCLIVEKQRLRTQ